MAAQADDLDLINLNDPNHRLKQFIKYQNTENLAAVQLRNDLAEKERIENAKKERLEQQKRRDSTYARALADA